MSNVATHNPFILDTAGVVTANPCVIQAIVWNWTADAAVGDEMILHDRNGNVVFKVTLGDVGTAANIPLTPTVVQFPMGLHVDGLTVPAGIDGEMIVFFVGNPLAS